MSKRISRWWSMWLFPEPPRKSPNSKSATSYTHWENQKKQNLEQRRKWKKIGQKIWGKKVTSSGITLSRGTSPRCCLRVATGTESSRWWCWYIRNPVGWTGPTWLELISEGPLFIVFWGAKLPAGTLYEAEVAMWGYNVAFWPLTPCTGGGAGWWWWL